MDDKKHEVRKYEVRTRLFAPRDPRRDTAAIVTLSGVKSAPPASTPPAKPEPKE